MQKQQKHKNLYKRSYAKEHFVNKLKGSEFKEKAFRQD